MRVLIALLSVALLSGCVAKNHAAESPEKRYQLHEQRGKSKRTSTFTKTLSLLAPEGRWTALGPYPRGAISFVGSANPYVSYRVEVLFSTADEDYKKQALAHLRSGSLENRVNEFLQDPKYEHPDPPPRPRSMKAKAVEFKGNRCVSYEHERHEGPSADPLASGKWAGHGHEHYFTSLNCDGFLNGVQGRFLIATYMMVSDRRFRDGISVDIEWFKRDLQTRVARSKASVEFNGEFTQVIPPGM